MFHRILFISLFLAANAWAGLSTNKLAVRDSLVDPSDTTWVYPTSVRADSLFGHLYGDADSLGGNPWTSYLRSDATDTVNGLLYLPSVPYTTDPDGIVQYVLGVNPYTNQLEFGTAVPATPTSTNATNLLVAGVAQPGSSFLRSNARDTLNAPLIIRDSGNVYMYANYPNKTAVLNITLQNDSSRGIYLTSGSINPTANPYLLYMTGSNRASTGAQAWVRMGEVGWNNIGYGTYIGSNATAFYNDITDTAIGLYNEMNFGTTSKSRGIYTIQDYNGGGRGIGAEFYDQGSGGNWPQIIFTRDSDPDTNRIYQGYIDFDSLNARIKVKADTFTAHKRVVAGSAYMDSSKSLVSGDSVISNKQVLSRSNTIRESGIDSLGNRFEKVWTKLKLYKGWIVQVDTGNVMTWAGDTLFVQKAEAGCMAPMGIVYDDSINANSGGRITTSGTASVAVLNATTYTLTGRDHVFIVSTATDGLADVDTTGNLGTSVDHFREVGHPWGKKYGKNVNGDSLAQGTLHFN